MKFSTLFRRTLLWSFAAMLTGTSFAQETLVGWEMSTLTGGSANYGPSPFAPGTVAANVTAGSLLRGSGILTTTGSGAASAWGGTGFVVSGDEPGSITSSEFITLSFTANSGYELQLNEFHLKNVRRSGTGPTSGRLQYRIFTGAPAGAYTDQFLWSAFGATTTAAGNTQAPVSLSGITVDPGETIEFRVLIWGATNAGGTWYINGNNIAGDDLLVSGTVVSLVPPAVATFTQLTNGIAVSPLLAGSTNHALFGFAASSDGTQTLESISFATTSNTNGVLTGVSLVSSTDNDFATGGDNAVVTATIVQNAGSIDVTGLSEVLGATAKHYFLVADVSGTVSISTPSVTVSLTDADVALDSGSATAFTITGDAYTFESAGSPVLQVSAVTPDFGGVCVFPALPPTGTFTLEGVDLDPGQDVVVGPLDGFEFFDPNLFDYASSITITQFGSLNEVIDVRFVPTAEQSYDGDIPVSGGGAVAVTAAVLGNGVNTTATVVTGAVSNVSVSGATVAGSYSVEGCSAVTDFGVVYSTTMGFDPATGTPVAGDDLGGGTWTSDLSGLESCTIYYARAYATNNGGTAYGDEVSFTTSNPPAPVAASAEDVFGTGFTATWDPVPGATGYLVDVSTLPNFAVEDFGSDLFISEYIEGSSNNKYIEIFNPTGATVDLSDYRLRLYSNGSLTATGGNDVALFGTLASGATVVLRNASATIYGGASIVVSAVNFNGDDAIALYKVPTASNVDIFGTIGEDPGAAWTGAGGYTTVNRTLVRKSTITGGVTTNPGGGFPTLVSEWDLFGEDVDDGLGAHSSVVPSVVPSFVPGYEAVVVGDTSLQVIGLDQDVTYYYRVRAIIGGCESLNSNTISVTTCAPAEIVSTSNNGPLCGADGLELGVVATGSLPLTYAWSGTGTFVPDNAAADVTVNGAATGDYTISVTNACGAVNEVIAVVVIIPGSACDDGNPNTVLDALDGNCDCVGVTCTTDLTIEWNTDANPTELAWELRTEGTNILVQSGDGSTFPANAAGYPTNTCLPNGTYYLVVTDAGGDGITGGGYNLRVSGGASIIINVPDNQGIGGFTSGGTSQVAGGLGFSIPVGGDNLISTSCDKQDWVAGQFIVANDNPAVNAQWGTGDQTDDGYVFWFYNPNGGYSFRRFRSHATSDGFPATGPTRACHTKLNNWAVANHIPVGQFLNVKIRSRVNGLNSNWGPACRFVLDPVRAACPLTNLMDTPGNSFFSCGVTKTWGGSNRVHAQPVSGATQYQFRFYNANESINVTRTTTTYYVNLNWMPALPNGSYSVEVRAFKNGAWCATSAPWGDVCTLNIVGSPAAIGGSQNMPLAGLNGDGALNLYPNPNNGEQLTVSLSAVEEGVTTVAVDLFDLTGARVSSEMIMVQDGFVFQQMDMNGLASGVYIMSITAGSQRYTERLVIQK